MLTKDRQAWEERVDERLRAIIHHAYTRAPAVRAKLHGAGVGPGEISGVADLERIPVTTKDELVRLQAADPPFGGFGAAPLEESGHVFVSPGPVYEPVVDRGSLGAGWVQEHLSAFGLAPGERALNAFAYHLAPAGLWLDRALRDFGLVVIPAGTGNTDIQARALRDLGIGLFCGTPSFLVVLLERAEALGYRWGSDLRLHHAVLGGDAFTPEIREEITRRGITPIQFYGTADVGIIACECPEGSLHLGDEMALEIVDPASGHRLPSGETGEVVATPFNEIYPLVRFGTGDLAFIVDGVCACGRPSPCISRLVGRVGHALKVRGMFLHPHQVAEVLAGVPGLGRYQVVVRREGSRDELLVRLEVGEGPQPSTDELRLRMQNLCRVRPDRVEILSPGSIPKDGAVLVDERVWDG